ncbi:MAG TPA: hypothetical protein VGE41_13060, partial [Verrucomicrobiae bacterium]
MPAAKCLVIRGGALGDFILTLPVLSALRRQFPAIHLALLGYSKYAELALAGGLVDELRSIDARPLAGFFARNGPLDSNLCAYFSEFALVISYLYDPDQIFEDNFAKCSKAQFIAGPHRPHEAERVHATSVFLKPLERLAIFDADPAPRLRLSSAQLPPGLEATGSWINHSPTVALHPGSGSETKNWPMQHWQIFLSLLAQQTSVQVLLILGEAEE